MTFNLSVTNHDGDYRVRISSITYAEGKTISLRVWRVNGEDVIVYLSDEETAQVVQALLFPEHNNPTIRK